jgi:type IV secretory pathway TraG/TraD family ATPase VirD4
MAWLKDTRDPVPHRILADDHRSDPTAALNLTKHLDPAAQRTTSGVERYLTLSMNALGMQDARELIGRRYDARAGHPVEQFDMPGFIAAGGTLYVLADAQGIKRARPLLSMVANEMFLAAESAALTMTRRKQLPQPFIGVLDELRYGVTVSELPYVASTLRKYNIGFIYSVQSATQEDVVYGEDAQALRDAAGVTLVGGIDISTAKELTDRAGATPVVTATRGPGHNSEHIQLQDTLTVGDQQKLADGEATIITRGLPPFIAKVPSFRDSRITRRRIEREAAAVALSVSVARAAERTARRSQSNAAEVGADFAGHILGDPHPESGVRPESGQAAKAAGTDLEPDTN